MKNDCADFRKSLKGAVFGLVLLLAAAIGAVVALNSAAGQLEPTTFLRPALIVCAILGFTGFALLFQGSWRIQKIHDAWVHEEEQRETKS
jgi:hypothetical protein